MTVKKQLPEQEHTHTLTIELDLRAHPAGAPELMKFITFNRCEPWFIQAFVEEVKKRPTKRAKKRT